MSIKDTFKQYAQEDAEEIKSILSDEYDIDVDVFSVNVEYREDDHPYAQVVAGFVTSEDVFATVDFQYDSEDNEVFIDQSTTDLAERVAEELKSQGVKATTKSIIYAADDDDTEGFADADEDESFDDFGDDSIEDNIDELSDQVEDLQDSIDEVTEDESSIDVDNNIENHYIAECESCHGIFISAVVESDQKVQKISGICPLCEKETDQYLNWIIRKANKDEESETRTF